MNVKKIGIYEIVFSCLLATIIILLSFDETLWIRFWSFLSIPAVNAVYQPGFSDFNWILKSLLSREHGFDPYIENPTHYMGVPYAYPSIWIDLFSLFNLKNIFIYHIVVFTILSLYFLVLFHIRKIFQNPKFDFCLLIFFLSTTNFLVIERLNVEIIMFLLVYYLLISKNFYIKLLFYLSAVLGKVFPIFSIIIFFDNKKKFVLVLFLTLIILFFYRNQLAMISKNNIEFALIFAYGIRGMLKAFYNYSIEFGYFLNESNLNFWRNMLISFGFLYVVLVFFFGFKKADNLKTEILDSKEIFFLCGGSIYLGTFILGPNLDYRLIFLIFALPYMLERNDNFYFKIIFLLSFFISINSLWFEGVDKFTYFYFAKGFFVHSCKLLLLTIFAFYIGKIFKEKNLFSLKKLQN